MKKFIIYLLKPFSFLPALLVMYMIFSFSSQTGVDSGNLSYKVSYGIVSVADRVLEKNLSEGDKEYYAGEIELPVRKLAHMTEYCILAICISFPLYVYGLRGFWLFIFAGLFCVAFACTDEFHQSFVAGRLTVLERCLGSCWSSYSVTVLQSRPIKQNREYLYIFLLSLRSFEPIVSKLCSTNSHKMYKYS